MRSLKVGGERLFGKLLTGGDSSAYLDKGYGAEAIGLSLTHGFELDLHRVSPRVLANNPRANACYRTCEFKE